MKRFFIYSALLFFIGCQKGQQVLPSKSSENEKGTQAEDRTFETVFCAANCGHIDSPTSDMFCNVKLRINCQCFQNANIIPLNPFWELNVIFYYLNSDNDICEGSFNLNISSNNSSLNQWITFPHKVLKNSVVHQYCSTFTHHLIYGEAFTKWNTKSARSMFGVDVQTDGGTRTYRLYNGSFPFDEILIDNWKEVMLYFRIQQPLI